MPKRTSYAQGTPNWVDLQTTDQQAAKSFYAGLFGWTYDDQPMEENQVYSMAKIGDHYVAAIAPQSPQLAAAGAPPAWNTYIAVDSADEAAALVGLAGGQIAMPPFDVMGAGRMAFVVDPGGAAVALWQARNHIGATLVNEPGTLVWNELVTANPAAIAFYQKVLGLTTATTEMGAAEYTLFQVDGKAIAGAIAPQAPGIANHWHVYFAVADVETAAAKITENDGSLLGEPFDSPAGRIAVARDPQGAVFSLIKTAEPA